MAAEPIPEHASVSEEDPADFDDPSLEVIDDAAPNPHDEAPPADEYEDEPTKPAPPPEGVKKDEPGDDDEPPGEEPDPEPKGKESEEQEPALPAALLSEAEGLGLSKDEAQSFGSPEALSAALTVLSRRVADWSRPGDTRGVPAPQAAPAPAQPPPPAPAPKVGAVEKPDIDWEAFDPELGKYVSYLESRIEGANALAARIDKFEAHIQRQALNEFAQEGDQFIQTLDADLRKELFEGDKAQEAQQQLLDQAITIGMGYEARGMKVPPDSVLYQQAFRALHGDKLTNLASKKLSKQLAQRPVTRTSRPTARGHQDDGLTPEQRAVRTASRMMQGWKTDATEDEF